MMLKNPAILIVAGLLAIGGYAAINQPDDQPLSDAKSGMFATFPVHTAIIDQYGVIASSDAAYEPKSALSFASGALTFGDARPMAVGTCGTVITRQAPSLTSVPPGSVSVQFTVRSTDGPVYSPAIGAAYYNLGKGDGWQFAYGVGTNAAGVWASSISLADGVAFRVFFTAGSCSLPAYSDTITATDTQYGPPEPPPDLGPPAPPPPGKVKIPITIGPGKIETKNIQSDVKITLTAQLLTAKMQSSGVTTPLVLTATKTIPAAGGNFTAASVEFDGLDLTSVAGVNSIKIIVTATATDATGATVGDTATLTQVVNVDGTGNVKITLKPASFVMKFVPLSGGAVATKTRGLVPVSLLG